MTERMTLADYVRELTLEHVHHEHYTIRVAGEWQGRDHRATVPGLLAQLWENDVPSSATEEGARAGYRSRPASRLDAHDTAIRIDLEAARWVRDLGEDDPGDRLDTRTGRHLPGSGTAACLRLLHALAPSANAETRRAIEHDVRRWWIRARIVTGWDSPAWTPDNTCPQCGDRGTLRVRLADHIGTCTNDACRVVWDETTIGLLADHIRAESESERQTRPGAGPCWCPVPEPWTPDLRYICPRCGSARCWHAVHKRLLASLQEAS